MIFLTTLGQMAVLFAFILLGYLLAKTKRVPQNGETVLSKLENDLFLPALVLETFMVQFTKEKLTSSWRLLGFSLALELVMIALSAVCVRLCSKDGYTRRIYLYGLAFSNFGFMGNAVVSALFPEIFFEYLIFTLVLWVLIYIWGVPRLLMGEEAGEQSRWAWLKRFANPMLICMVIGMILGLSDLKMPSFVTTLVGSAADCMSPVAMLLTGMTLAKMDLLRLLKMKGVYVITALRLLVFPLAFLGIYVLCGVTLPRSFLICAVASLAMPLGLNTIVIPGAYGKDTTTASAMALISHTLALATIPLVFWLMEKVL